LIEVLLPGRQDSPETREALARRLRSAAEDVGASAFAERMRIQQFAEDVPIPPRAAPATTAPAPAPARKHGKKKPPQKPIDFSKYPTRHIALHVAYAGWDYHGFASQGNDAAEARSPTIEGALFAALKRTRLIADDATWTDVDYTRCGRTDAGVSAMGQLVSLRARSRGVDDGHRRAARRRDVVRVEDVFKTLQTSSDEDEDADARPTASSRPKNRSREERVDRETRYTPPSPPPPAKDADELDYPSILNRALPDDIRVTGWCYVDEAFSARFDCEWRHYKYFFTLHDGGLDLEKMRDAARRLEGEHDFRNFCKMDVKNVHNHARRILECAVVAPGDSRTEHDDRAWLDGGHGDGAGACGLGPGRSASSSASGAPPRLCYISVKGTAFLWHQVRCVAAVLFLVGLGKEPPSVIDDLLDLEKTTRKPQYEMAPEEPLLLWASGFDEAHVRRRLSGGAKAQLELHVAQLMFKHRARAGKWAEVWASLKLGEDGGSGGGGGDADVDADVDAGANGNRKPPRRGASPAALCSYCAFGPSLGNPDGGHYSYVRLHQRVTEPTYEERIAALEAVVR